MTTMVVFDRKNDLVQGVLADPGLPLILLNPEELAIAFLQPIPGMPLARFISVIVNLIGAGLRLIASQRLLLETLQLLYRRHRPAGEWPTLREWIKLIADIRADPVSRRGQYREATLAALQGIDIELGEALNFSSSDFLDRLYTTHGCFVIRTGGLSTEAASFLACIFVNHVFESRGLPDPAAGANPPVIFVLDDALPLVRGSVASESEGGINPLSTWAFMGRSRNLGFVVAAQNFSLISPALRNNADTILCFGSYGRDGEEVGRHLSLNPDQAGVLPVLRPGQVVAIARSVWPQAVFGCIPEVS